MAPGRLARPPCANAQPKPPPRSRMAPAATVEIDDAMKPMNAWIRCNSGIQVSEVGQIVAPAASASYQVCNTSNTSLKNSAGARKSRLVSSRGQRPRGTA